MNGSVPEPARGVCRWVKLPTAPGVRKAPHFVICVACGLAVPFLDAWTTIPYSPVTDLPISSGYVHCAMCSVALDATAAWMAADRRWRANSLKA